jgi:hypothetical protein
MIKKLKNKLIDLITVKPKKDFWFYAFIVLLFFRYVTPVVLVFMTFFQVGLIMPDVDATQIMNDTATRLAESFTSVLGRLFEAGSQIALQNPILAKILFYVISGFVYTCWVAMILLILNFVRYGTAWIFNHKKNIKKGIKGRFNK